MKLLLKISYDHNFPVLSDGSERWQWAMAVSDGRPQESQKMPRNLEENPHGRRQASGESVDSSQVRLLFPDRIEFDSFCPLR